MVFVTHGCNLILVQFIYLRSDLVRSWTQSQILGPWAQNDRVRWATARLLRTLETIIHAETIVLFFMVTTVVIILRILL